MQPPPDETQSLSGHRHRAGGTFSLPSGSHWPFMKTATGKYITAAVLIFLSLALVSIRTFASDKGPNLPRVFYADPGALAAAKSRLAVGDPGLRPALSDLLGEADHLLDMKPPSVMDKKGLPPSGDKHDFLSWAPYYWPNTNSPGNQYVRMDGRRNPEADEDSDAGKMLNVCASAHTLALAFYFTGKEQYAVEATEFVRVWFLNPDTRMNPNLNYGQGVPGRAEGRPEGIISARGLVELVDAIGLLAGSQSWTAADQAGITQWLGDYFHWLTTSRLALREGSEANNHGTYYDTQVAALALFLGKTDVARELLLADRSKRIARQIEPDGRQPLELSRTLSFDYSLFNLRALFDLASIGRNAGVDLWHYQTPDGRGVLEALKFMAGFANPEKPWTYKQIHKPNRNSLADLLLRGSAVYSDREIGEALKYFHAGKLAGSQINLMFPTPANAGH